MGSQLTLIDQALLLFVHHLDRVFQGDNVARAGAIDVVDDARQGGGLARAGRAAHQHQAVLQLGEALHHRGQAQVFQHRDAILDDAEHGRQPRHLAKHVGAETQPFRLERQRKIYVAQGLQVGHLLDAQIGRDDVFDVRGREHVAGERHDPAHLLHGGAQPARQDEVVAVIFGQPEQQSLQQGKRVLFARAVLRARDVPAGQQLARSAAHAMIRVLQQRQNCRRLARLIQRGQTGNQSELHLAIGGGQERRHLGRGLVGLHRLQGRDANPLQFWFAVQQIDDVGDASAIADGTHCLDRALAHPPIRIALCRPHQRPQRPGILEAQERIDRIAPDDVRRILQVADQVPGELLARHADQSVHHPLAHPPILVAQVAQKARRQLARGIAHLLGDVHRHAPHVHVLAAQKPQDGARQVHLAGQGQIGQHLGRPGAHVNLLEIERRNHQRKNLVAADGLGSGQHGEPDDMRARVQLALERVHRAQRAEALECLDRGLGHVEVG